MKTLDKSRILTILAFFLIIIPGSKVSLFNFLILGLLIMDFLFSIGVDSIDLSSSKDAIFAAIVLLSVFLLIKKSNKFVVALCVLVMLLHLINLFKMNYLSVWYFAVPTTFFLIFSSMLLFNLFFKKDKNLE